MSKMYNHLNRMLPVAESVGDITSLDMGDWANKYERISICGKTPEGRDFELVLEVTKEVEQDGN